jgi:hypothetical protein
MSDSILVTYWATCWPYTAIAAICFVVATACTGFVQHAHTARYRLQGMSDCVNTRNAGVHYHVVQKRARQTSQLQLFAS